MHLAYRGNFRFGLLNPINGTAPNIYRSLGETNHGWQTHSPVPRTWHCTPQLSTFSSQWRHWTVLGASKKNGLTRQQREQKIVLEVCRLKSRLSFRIPPSSDVVILRRAPDSHFKWFMTMHWSFLMRNNQQVNIQLCRYFVLQSVKLLICSGHLLWPSRFNDPFNIPSKTPPEMDTIDGRSR